MPFTETGKERNFRLAERRWAALCNLYLPVGCRKSIWRQSRWLRVNDLSQGWKLHVSATILSACAVLRTIGPYLQQRGALFKGPKSLDELRKLNAGLKGGFSQIGKCITVYPASTEAAVEIARNLHALMRGFEAPVVPYDQRFRDGSCVYYRYGAFPSLRPKLRRGSRTLIKAADGKLVEDRCAPGAALPFGLVDPFRKGAPKPNRQSITPLETDYEKYRAIVQRGRGGVYRAMDISLGTARPCVIKEGRRYGETDRFGRDGYDCVKREAEFLRSVADRIAAVPHLRRTFRANGNYYIVQDEVRGRSLESVITSKKPISRDRLLNYCVSMMQIVAEIHRAGWAWRDCKPANFLCLKKERLVATDFERACRLSVPDPLTLTTRGYMPRYRPIIAEQIDLYALGTSLMQLVARRRSPAAAVKAFTRAAQRLQLPSRLIIIVRSLRSSSCQAASLQLALTELKKLRSAKRSGKDGRAGQVRMRPIRDSYVEADS